MNVFLYPLRYLMLKDEHGFPLFTRDLVAVIVLAALMSAPFWLLDLNYFSSGGFLDRFGAFAGVLTGFYVAGLVGVATFLTAGSSLDDVMEKGSLKDPSSGKPLTRRQYVSAMFGYLACIALVLSLVALLAVVVAAPARDALVGFLPLPVVQAMGAAVLFLLNVALAHMTVTTLHGFYYLIERIYEPRSELATKPSVETPTTPAA